MRRVLTHGCFDIIHCRHVRLLKYARSLGDELVVSLLSDKYVRMYKGEKRPLQPLDMRIEQMRELRCVDRVVVVDGPGHEAVQAMIAEVQPAIYVKGGEYDGRLLERAFLEALGVQIVYMNMDADLEMKVIFGKALAEFRD